MMLDNVNNAGTVSFQVSQVRRGHHEAIVRAVQVVKDPDGGTDTIYQTYHLVQVDGRYMIADFMSSKSPF
ncbi:MAG TPA: hypothetical protein VG944_16380, partial [Fimbriimonas sp.]|nr:hypothetical protein [Fimbriimonas sp.]